MIFSLMRVNRLTGLTCIHDTAMNTELGNLINSMAWPGAKKYFIIV